ncbi:MAG: hypothetical protein AB3K77_05875 [Methanosarcinaceae archaeon]|uniref:hypothetical protein n=1 Tax=Methanosarcina sp. MTP4 TaxID=1434100 RepID=UPI000A952158|nr:hypothetical protein [Methanosarcina sp. MTP4]
MTENTGRPYEIRSISQGMGRSTVLSMVQIMIRITGRSMEIKVEQGNHGAGRNC